MTTMMIPPGMRVSNPESGPLADGGYRWCGARWAVDLDASGAAAAIVAWPKGLDDADYRRGARAAIRRAQAALAAAE